MTYYLGGQDSLHQILENRKQELRNEVEGFTDAYLLGNSPDHLADYLVDKHGVDPPRLVGEPELSQRTEKRHVDDPFRGGTRPIDVTVYELHIPFEGSPKFFSLRPSRFTMNPPQVDVQGNVLVAFVLNRNPGDAGLKGELDRLHKAVADAVAWLANDLKQFNEQLRPFALQQVERRRARALEAAKSVEGLGFKLKARPGTETYAVSPRKRISISRPPAPKPGAPAEPVFPMQDYEDVLRIAGNVVTVMERNPSVFHAVGEETIRDHILVSLNGVYEGQATGETFNGSGKTDILLRVDGKNIFIAECKIWSGESDAKAAIDQLLGYLTWRDTKAALFIFSRNKDFTNVVAKMRDAVRLHPNFLREVPYSNESGIRAVFKQKDDSSRELYLTALAFAIPTP